ncbi:hypothetical protein [Clostridium chrysemydis]|uniref:hypothetical protein n=1 Tax=Clostridium chrysemydis TaxID=2665504 RepID=UPI0018846608|nr:hypothetical protein [Clostridium chrysemydis]
MDYATLVGNLGFPIATAVIGCGLLYKNLNSRIQKLEQENKEDKQMFNRALDSFNVTVEEFKLVGKDITGIKQDITEIKYKLK